jgi:hypothetical protein
MALSAAEARELAQLEAELSPQPKKSALSKQEEMELAQLEQEMGPVAQNLRTSPAIPATPDESWERGMIRKGLGLLPVAGSIAGGVIGTVAGAPTGPGAIATGVGGAALGGAAGEAYKQLGERYFLDEGPKTSEEAATKIGTEGLVSGAGQLAGNVAGKGLGLVAKTKPVQGLVRKVGSGLAKVGEMATGVPKKIIETFAKKTPEVEQMAKASGDDLQAAADTVRKGMNKAVQSARGRLSGQISKAVEAGEGKFVDPRPILKSLADEKAKINPKLNPEFIEQIDELARKVKVLSGQNKQGKIGLKDANDLKGYLQDVGSSAYHKGGQIFQYGKPTAKAAKAGAAETRKGVNVAAPEIAGANEKLARLHQIEKTSNRNLLKEGASPAGLLSAGSGSNTNNIKALQELGEITGTDMVGEAEKLAAMRTFGDAPLMPMDATGKAVGRVMLGGSTGYAVTGDKEGAMMGAALTSPAALKGMIKGGRGLINAAGLIGGSGALSQPVGRGIMSIPEMIKRMRDAGYTDEEIQQQIGQVE